MLDPKEQAKGGLRARAAREQERLEVLAGLRRDAEAEGVTADLAATTEPGAEGSPPVAPPATDGPTSAYPPPTGRQPKRWR